MSRAYRITLSESLTRAVDLGDAVQASIELLPILDPGRMSELLGQALAEQGFAVADGRAARTSADGVAVTVDLADGTATVSLAERATLVADATATAESDAVARKKARAAAETKLEQSEAAARAALTARLSASLAGLRADLDRAVTLATGRALEEKARQMGEIEDIHRDEATGSLTIRVRL